MCVLAEWRCIAVGCVGVYIFFSLRYTHSPELNASLTKGKFVARMIVFVRYIHTLAMGKVDCFDFDDLRAIVSETAL